MGIPPGISEVLLPRDDLNVLEFIDFVIPLGEHTPDLLAMDDSNPLFENRQSDHQQRTCIFSSLFINSYCQRCGGFTGTT